MTDEYMPWGWAEPEIAVKYHMFVRYGDVNCAYGEDAGYYTGWKGYDKAPFECDGYDNDMDGVVDEGAADLDANGVADCME